MTFGNHPNLLVSTEQSRGVHCWEKRGRVWSTSLLKFLRHDQLEMDVLAAHTGEIHLKIQWYVACPLHGHLTSCYQVRNESYASSSVCFTWNIWPFPAGSIYTLSVYKLGRINAFSYQFCFLPLNFRYLPTRLRSSLAPGSDITFSRRHTTVMCGHCHWWHGEVWWYLQPLLR